MDFFDKHKALILTMLTCSVLILGLYNFHLSKKQKATGEMMVNLDQFLKEPEIEEPSKELQDQKSQQRTSVKTHQAFNENKAAREEDFNKKLEEIFEKNAANQEESSANQGSEGNYALNEPKPKKKAKSQGDDATKKISTKDGGIRDSSISFSLKGRSAITIPNPIYTCDRAGKIVVNIVVNEKGDVISTSINKSSSSTLNECLTEQALQYAKGARFSKLAGKEKQPGTITYQFKP